MSSANSGKITDDTARLVILILNSIIQNEVSNELKELITGNRIDWKRFKDFIIYHEIFPSAYIILKDYNSLLSKEFAQTLRSSYYLNLKRCEYLWQEFLKIVNACQDSKIVLLPIKGIALLADVYVDSPLRHMVDIDVLVQENELPKIEKILYGLGYKKNLGGLKENYWRKYQCHIAFSKMDIKGTNFCVEVHWLLDFKRKNRSILPDLWQRIREVSIRGQKLNLISPEDTFFSLALHQRRFGPVLSLKYALDLGLLLKKYATEFNWDYVFKEAEKGKICSSVFFILSHMYLLSKEFIPLNTQERLHIPVWKKKAITLFIKKNAFQSDVFLKLKYLYLQSHFLLYDSIWESIGYIFNIPQEQFAKYYGLAAYAKRTKFLYSLRLLYMPLMYILKKVF